MNVRNRSPQAGSSSEIMEILWPWRTPRCARCRRLFRNESASPTPPSRRSSPGSRKTSGPPHPQDRQRFFVEPLITRTSVYRRMIDEFLDLFGGSGQPVVARLLETGSSPSRT